MEARSVHELSNVLAPIFLQYNIRKAVLFGSVAKGNASNSSDIDILVDSGLKGLRFVGFMEDVRRAVDRNIDMLDVAHIEPGSRIDREISKTGVVIYEK